MCDVLQVGIDQYWTAEQLRDQAGLRVDPERVEGRRQFDNGIDPWKTCMCNVDLIGILDDNGLGCSARGFDHVIEPADWPADLPLSHFVIDMGDYEEFDVALMS